MPENQSCKNIGTKLSPIFLHILHTKVLWLQEALLLLFANSFKLLIEVTSVQNQNN